MSETKLWPAIWPNDTAARRALEGPSTTGVGKLIMVFEPVTYRPIGPKKMKWRVGYFDLARIPDPKAWLEDRLGPVEFVTGGPAFGEEIG